MPDNRKAVTVLRLPAHLLVICFALSLAAKSAWCAPEIRISRDFIVLPDDLSTTDPLYGNYLGPLQVGHALAQTFRVTNVGDSTLSISNVTLNGPGAAAFTQQSATTFQLEPAQAALIDITFAPAMAGSYPITIGVASDDPANPSYDFLVEGNARDSYEALFFFPSIEEKKEPKLKCKAAGCATKLKFLAENFFEPTVESIDIRVYQATNGLVENITVDLHQVTSTKGVTPYNEKRGKPGKRNIAIKVSDLPPTTQHLVCVFSYNLVGGDGERHYISQARAAFD